LHLLHGYDQSEQLTVHFSIIKQSNVKFKEL